MASMDHCRFHNTLEDLTDCRDALNAIAENGGDWGDLSDDEARKAKALLQLCRDIDFDFGDFIDG